MQIARELTDMITLQTWLAPLVTRTFGLGKARMQLAPHLALFTLE